MSSDIAIKNQSYDYSKVTRASHITMMVVLVALAIIVLVFNAYPQIPCAEFFSKDKFILLSFAGGMCCVTLALHILALLKKSNNSKTIFLPMPPLSDLTLEQPIEEDPIIPSEETSKQIVEKTSEKKIVLEDLPEQIDEARHPITTPLVPQKVRKVRSLHTPPVANPIVQGEKKTLRQDAIQAIENGKSHYKRVDWTQIHLMHNTTYIKDSSYDQGVQSLTSLSSYLNYLAFLKNQGAFFTMDEGTFGEMIDTLQSTKEILQTSPCALFGHVDGTEARPIVNLINEQLHKKERAYSFAGYCGEKDNPGHVVVCKFKKEKLEEHTETPREHLTFYFLNLGEGIQHKEYQPDLNATATQIKISRCTYPSQIPLEDWNHVAEGFICHLMRYATDAPGEIPYSTWELYQLQSALAPPNPSLLLPFAEKMEGKPQFIGDCADKASRNIMIDFLGVEKNLTESQIRIFFLNLHLASLVSAFHTYTQSGELQQRKFLINAMEEFANFLLRSKDLVEEKEFLLASEIVDVILSEVKNHEIIPLSPIDAHHLIPLSTQFPAISVPQNRSSLRFSLSLKSLGEYPENHSALTSPLFDPKKFKIHLNQREDFAFDFIYALPIPQWDAEQDPWNDVPIEDIEEILTDLTKLKSDIWHSFSLESEAVVCVLTLFAIVDKLVRRDLKKTKLENFATPFAMDLVERYVVFHSAELERKYQLIKSYFANNQAAAKGKIAFPLTTTFHFNYYRVERLAGKSTPETDLLDFLDQFTTSLRPNYATLWEKLPIEVHTLYYFAYWADLIGNGRLQKLRDQEKRLMGFPLTYIHQWGGSLTITRPGETWMFNTECLALEDQFLKHRKSNTNEVVCHSKQQLATHTPALIGFTDEKISSAISEELIILHQHGTLKIGLAIPWMRNHPFELNDKIVQKTLEGCFFSPGTLKERIEAVPEMVQEIRKLIEESLKLYRNQPEHVSAILFLTRFAVTFEDYVKHEKILTEKSTLPFCEKYLDTFLSTLSWEKDEDAYMYTLMHYLYLRLNKEEEISQQPIIELYTHLCKIRASGFKWSFYWSHFGRENLSYYLLDRFLKKWHHFLSLQGDKQQETLNCVCTSILTSLFGDQIEITPTSWRWTSQFSCESDTYGICFINGAVKLNFCEGSLTYLTEHKRKFLQTQDFNLKNNALWWQVQNDWTRYISVDRDNYLSLDGSMVLLKRDWKDKTYFFQIDQINKYTKINTGIAFNQNDSSILYFLKHFDANPKSERGPSKGSKRLIFSQKNNPEPFVRIDSDSLGTSITRLDEKGNPLPYKLANLQRLDRKHPFYAYTLQIAPYDHILCFIHETTGEIEELYFPSLNLTFKNKNGKLVGDEPDFFFTPIPIHALGSLSPHAIVLQGPEGCIKLILPSPPQIKLPLEYGKKQKDKIDAFSGNYCTYHLRSSKDSITFSSLYDQLFFVYFLKAHGEYRRAFQELKKIRTFTFNADIFDILDKFFHIPDQTPYSLAFNLRLILFAVDHFHLIDKKFIPNAHYFLNRASLWYVDYLRVTEEDHFNAVPCEWRLTLAEESRLLTTLIREKIKIPKILQIREELLHTQEHKAEIEFQSQDGPSPVFANVFLPLKLFKLLEYPPYGLALPFKDRSLIAHPNRVSKDYVETHFCLLYEEAKKALKGRPDPFDFTLLALLKQEQKELSSLLFYVRHFPEHFKGLAFLENQTEQEKSNTFKAIVQKVVLLQFSPGFQAFEEKYLSQTTQFNYTKKTTLTLPSTEITSNPLPQIQSWDIEQQPFVDLCGVLFEEKDGTSFSGLTLFDESILAQHPLTQELHQEYAQAYTTLSQESTPSYHLKSDKLDYVRVKLKSKHKEYVDALKIIKKKILDYVNDPFHSFHDDFTVSQESEFRLRLNGHQTYSITPEMIMKEVILKDNTALFDEHRPMLSTQHIQVILEEVHHYYHIKVLTKMASEAIGYIDTLEKKPDQPLIKKDLLTVLNYTFLYVPQQYPEISYMKVKTGKLPRPDQIEVYKWVCEGLALHEDRLFQLPAGGGKTSYLIPLMILRCHRSKLLPCVLTTQAMYLTEKENLGLTLSLLGIELDTLEIGMHSSLSLKKLKTIYQNLKRNLLEGNALLVTPQTFYALRLMYFTSSVEDEKGEKTLLLQKIMHYLKSQALLLGDESHRNFNPLTQAVFGVGQFDHLTHGELSLLFKYMKRLLGIGEYGLPIAADTLDKSDIQKIKKILASLFTDNAEVIPFLTDKKAAEPPCLASWDDKTRYLALMTRYFLNSLLPKILKMKVDFDHVHSQEQGEIDTPAYHKTPSHAQFKDPYLTTVLTIKGIWHRGLNEHQIRALIQKLQEMDREEQSIALGRKATPSQKKFHGWVKSTFPNLALGDVDLKKRGGLEALFGHLKKHPDAIEYYLFLMIYSRIGYSTQQFTSTPAHLMGMGKCSIIFSATPLTRIAYPEALQKVLYDPLFEARVIAQASKANNQNFIILKDVNDFFVQLSDQKHSLQGRYMVDADGLLCHEENGEVARRWLQASSLDGVIYFKEDESLALMLRDGRIITFQGTNDLKYTLASHNIDWDNQAIGVFLDAPHAESANFPPIPHSSAYIMAGNTLNLSHAIQSIMRARGFLDDSIDQQIVWAIPETLLYKKGVSKEEFGSRTLFSWLLQNEVKAHKSTILMAAFQEITFKIENYGFSTAENRSLHIRTYASGFKEHARPNQAWESQEKLENTGLLLRNFAKETYARFQYEIPYEDNLELINEIDQIIAEVEKKIAQIQTNFQARRTTEVHQKCLVHVHEEVKKLQYPFNPFPIKPEPLRPYKLITDKDYPKSLDPQNEVRAIFNTPHLTQNFFIEPNQLYTGIRLDVSLKEKFLKPIDYILITLHKDQVYAEGVALDVAVHQLEGLKNPPEEALEHQAFLITADGLLYEVGKGVLAPDKDKIDHILNSLWLKDILIDVALLKGQILDDLDDNSRFTNRIKQWPDFPDFWRTVLEALPHPKDYSLQAIESFLPPEAKEYFLTSQGDNHVLH